MGSMTDKVKLVGGACRECEMRWVATIERIEAWPRCPFCGTIRVTFQPVEASE